MNNKSYVGVLGDPAKLDSYNEEFYSILLSEINDFVFHLIGASESNVDGKAVTQMYLNFKEKLDDQKMEPLSIFKNRTASTGFSSRIGLFPSQRNQLIKGPSFIFAPYPLNSSSKYLRYKSKFTINMLKYFSPYNIMPVAYCPIGGKAAKRTDARSLNINEMAHKFYMNRKNNWFDLFYLEAGSGQKKLTTQNIQDVLEAQAKRIKGISFVEEYIFETENRILIPNAVYGGGIRTKNDIDEILAPKGDKRFIPEMIILGNISEENVSKTYQLIDRIKELNEIESQSIYY